ncbi:MAG: hypothetical protein DWH79_07285, partial [Planctomycetota bacterium]
MCPADRGRVRGKQCRADGGGRGSHADHFGRRRDRQRADDQHQRNHPVGHADVRRHERHGRDHRQRHALRQHDVQPRIRDRVPRCRRWWWWRQQGRLRRWRRRRWGRPDGCHVSVGNGIGGHRCG